MQTKKKPLFLHQESGFAPDNSLPSHAATSSLQRVAPWVSVPGCRTRIFRASPDAKSILIQRVKIFKNMLNKYKGCLLGLAVGDALGAAVEFMSSSEIKNKYGEGGIQDFDEWGRFRAGSYTDDTQMVLATAKGCINAADEWKTDGVFEPTPYVYGEYLDWLETQNDPFERRAPGNTCLSALGTILIQPIIPLCSVQNPLHPLESNPHPHL
jgi:hypothetical protein